MARIFNFNMSTCFDFRPSKVFLDTTFTLDLLQKDSKSHQSSIDFFDHCINFNIEMVTSEEVLIDTSHKVQLHYLSEVADQHGIDISKRHMPYWRKNAYKELENQGVDVISSVFGKTHRDITQLRNLITVYGLSTPLDELMDLTLKVRRKGLPNTLEDGDIHNLLIMDHSSVSTIITEDRAFDEVDKINVVRLNRKTNKDFLLPNESFLEIKTK